MSQIQIKIANIAVISPISLGMDCEEYFYALASSGKYPYFSFLDSSLVPNKYSKYSYLAFEPDFAIKSSKQKNTLIYCDSELRVENGLKSCNIKEDFYKIIKTSLQGVLLNGCKEFTAFNDSARPVVSLNDPAGFTLKESSFPQKPFEFLKIIFDEFITCDCLKFYFDGKRLKEISKKSASFRLPDFTGGFTGYFSYDLKDFIESLPATVEDDQNIPLFYFLHYSRLLAFCHKSRKWFLINNIPVFKDNTAKSDGSFTDFKACTGNIFRDYIKDFVEKEKDRILDVFKGNNVLKKDAIINGISKHYSGKKPGKIKLASNFTKDDYLKAVIKAKKYIHKGDIYQVNMTQRFECRPGIRPYDLYFILRRKNAAPFSAYLSFPGLIIGSSSPERFLLLKNDEIETRPIKGTRPRGSSIKEDRRYESELKKSIKDRAELNMIVDLERNDLGKFCRYGTVKVREHAIVEKYARVFHLVSTVKGRVQKGYGITDILKASFPGGSITGAPKIRAMEIIDELETVARGVYTGSIGYIGNDKSMDLNIVIRTFIIKDGMFYYNAGGGIVEDSSAEAEYLETLDKGIALKESLEYFSGG